MATTLFWRTYNSRWTLDTRNQAEADQAAAPNISFHYINTPIAPPWLITPNSSLSTKREATRKRIHTLENHTTPLHSTCKVSSIAHGKARYSTASVYVTSDCKQVASVELSQQTPPTILPNRIKRRVVPSDDGTTTIGARGVSWWQRPRLHSPKQ